MDLLQCLMLKRATDPMPAGMVLFAQKKAEDGPTVVWITDLKAQEGLPGGRLCIGRWKLHQGSIGPLLIFGWPDTNSWRLPSYRVITRS